MNGRALLATVVGNLQSWVRPTAAAAVAGKLVRIGVLGTLPWPPFDALREHLRELGYAEGNTISFEYRRNKGRNGL